MEKCWLQESVKPAYKTAKNLETKYNIHQLYSSKPIDLLKEAAEALCLKGTESILDIGCGAGNFLLYLRKVAKHQGLLWGLDISSKLYQKAKKESEKLGLKIQFIEASALKMPFSSKSFDVITAQHMLCHLPDIKKGLIEAKRILKTQGTFLATANSTRSYPHVRKYREKIGKLMGWDKISYTSLRFNSENMGETLKNTFRVVKLKTLKGELKIPPEPFLGYFASTFDLWSPKPKTSEFPYILDQVAFWVNKDLNTKGFIVEPKWATLAVCKK